MSSDYRFKLLIIMVNHNNKIGRQRTIDSVVNEVLGIRIEKY